MRDRKNRQGDGEHHHRDAKDDLEDAEGRGEEPGLVAVAISERRMMRTRK